MAKAHRPKFDAVILWKFDRIARAVSRLLGANVTHVTAVWLTDHDTYTNGCRLCFH